MDLLGPRCRDRRNLSRVLSIPHNFTRRPPDVFDAQDARHLIAKLQNLDSLLQSLPLDGHSKVDFNNVPCSQGDEHPSPTAKVNEAVVRCVQETPVRRSEGIIQAYGKAYSAAIAGRVFMNQTHIVDFSLGRECTCSEALAALHLLDPIIGTTLALRLVTLNDTVSPFPLLRLPAELRLHVYSFYLPSKQSFIVTGSSRTPGRISHNALRSQMNIMLVSQQIASEIRRFCYMDRPLVVSFVIALKPFNPDIPDHAHHLHDQFQPICKIIETISPNTRAMFKILVLDFKFGRPPVVIPETIRSCTFAEIFAQFPNLEKILVTSDSVILSLPMVKWLISSVPVTFHLEWDLRHPTILSLREDIDALMENRQITQKYPEGH
ncbi:hypothetical protein B0J11DRAFT_582525 [Dendryphion nanum]|uniref:Uncharacterized protein n=1 Tax=Dendryphion nanum TaxID=256645 RepID=A0A9P9IGQ2_9PLEO|nr:hypothetical protein B0J11DRAFT_582525 [Dendryphion nanum]